MIDLGDALELASQYNIAMSTMSESASRSSALPSLAKSMWTLEWV